MKGQHKSKLAATRDSVDPTETNGFGISHPPSPMKWRSRRQYCFPVAPYDRRLFAGDVGHLPRLCHLWTHEKSLAVNFRRHRL
jgi:hypothetical protein